MKKILTEEGRKDIRFWVNRARTIAGPDEIIDLEALAHKAGIKIKRGNFNNEFMGMLALKGNRFTIHLHIEPGENLNSPFVRYTLAHELGHFFIFSHKARLLRGEGNCEEG